MLAGDQVPGQPDGIKQLSADGSDGSDQSPANWRTVFGSSQRSATADASAAESPPADSRTKGEKQAAEPEAADAMQAEPVAAVNGSGSAARARRGKAIGDEVATDGMEVTDAGWCISHSCCKREPVAGLPQGFMHLALMYAVFVAHQGRETHGQLVSRTVHSRARAGAQVTRGRNSQFAERQNYHDN